VERIEGKKRSDREKETVGGTAMKSTYRIMTVAGILVILLCLLTGLACAESADGGNRFPEGVIEVPMGTMVVIDDGASTVTITDCPVEIKEGDTFVVYLQSLPIGYVANSVTESGGSLVVSAEKADKGVYELLDSEGEIAITPDMYEFVPAPNVTYEKNAVVSRSSDGGLSYSDGKLTMTIPLGDSKVEAYLSDMHLSYSVSDGGIGVSLNGTWGITTELNSTTNFSQDIPLGEMRIAGIGKIEVALSIEHQMSLTCDLSGSFNVGINASMDGDGTASKGFSLGKKTIEGKGNISAAIKVTAGVDVLVAAADLYVAVGAETQVTTKSTYHENTKETTLCEDYRVYVFSTVGVEAMYYSPLENRMKPLVSKQLNEGDASAKPCIVAVHYENDVCVRSCSQGMEVPERQYGGFDAGFSGTILSGNRERILETNITLPWDMTIDRDLTLSGGNLDLGGHTLVINGDLIQAGGTLIIGSGTLIVHGDYRMQSGSEGGYGDSSAALNMSLSSGTVSIDGDFIIQTNSTASRLTAGTIQLKGNFYQLNAAGSHQSFNSGKDLNLVMTEDNSHIIKFEDAESNSIGKLTLNNDVEVQSSLRGGVIDLNAHQLTVNGTLYHADGTITLGGGKLTVTGNYYNAGADSIFEAGNENFTISRAYLWMADPADEMRVGGNFIVRSWGYSGNRLTAGTLYLAGDFRQLISSATNNFVAGADHKTVLNGTEEQVISFEGVSSGFGTLEATNEQLVFQNNVNWAAQTSDIHAVSNGAKLGNQAIDLKGHQLTIDGDVEICANLGISGGKLTVNGTLRHSNGTITLGGGALTVTGNYYNAGADSTFEAGNENFTISRAYLWMADPADEMRVGGDFIVRSWGYSGNGLTAGTLYLAGDFRQLNSSTSNNFIAGANHKTVLNGTAEQVISFEGVSSGFGTLEATNEQLVFQNNVNWAAQASDIHAVSKGAKLGNRAIDLNGHQLTIDGDVEVYSDVKISGGELRVNGTLRHPKGMITLGGGKLTVTGSYYSVGADSTFDAGNENITPSSGYLWMANPADEMRVGGDFVVKAEDYDSGLHEGTLYLAGDFSQLMGHSNNFRAGANHKTVLNGTGEQVIRFDGASSGFGTLEALNEQLVFQNNVNWAAQASDIHAVSNGAKLSSRSIDLNGHQLTIDGDVEVYSDVKISGGELRVNGTLRHPKGMITLGGGKLTVTGSYYSVGADSTFDADNENITPSSGYLWMANPADEMRVGGDFVTRADQDDSGLTAGTLYLTGDFTQLMGHPNNFRAGENHKTVLNGTGKQVISFASTSSRFGTLELTKRLPNYTFNPNPCWLALIEPQLPMNTYVLPYALTVIEEEAFEGNQVLEAVTAPNGLTRIEARAFKGCSYLLEFTLPESVTYIAPDAFVECPNLALRVANDYCENYAKEHQIAYTRGN